MSRKNNKRMKHGDSWTASGERGGTSRQPRTGFPWESPEGGPPRLSALKGGLVALAGLCLAMPAHAQIDGLLTDISGLNEAQTNVGARIEQICPPGGLAEDLQDRCNNLVGGRLPETTTPISDAETAAVLERVAPEEIITQGTNVAEISHVQRTNIASRILALRAGSTGISIAGLSINVDGQTLSGDTFASLLPDQATGGAAGADEFDLFKRLGIFVNGTVSFGDKDATNDETGFDVDTYGVTVGADYRLTDQLVLGASFSYTRQESDFDNSAGDLDADAYTGSIYGTFYATDRFFIDGIFSYGGLDYDSSRKIVYANATDTIDSEADGDTDGSQYALSIGAGYDLDHGALTVSPLVRVDYIETDIDKFSEDGGDGWALRYGSQTVKSLTTALGGQVSYALSLPWGVIQPQGRLEWVHQFEDDSRTITSSFVGDPNVNRFSVPTDSPDRDYFALGFGVSSVFQGGTQAFLNYETVLGFKDVANHIITAGIRLEL